MAATVIDDYADELTLFRSQDFKPMAPNVTGGRVRIGYFTHTFATEAAGQDVALAVLPAGARLLGGKVGVSATTGSATLSFGLAGKDATGFIDKAGTVSDDVAALKAAAAITSTTTVDLCATTALRFGVVVDKEVYITVTTAAAAMAAQVLTGYFFYVVD